MKTISKYRLNNHCEFIREIHDDYLMYVQKGIVDRYFIIWKPFRNNSVIPIHLEIQGPTKDDETITT